MWWRMEDDVEGNQMRLALMRPSVSLCGTKSSQMCTWNGNRSINRINCVTENWSIFFFGGKKIQKAFDVWPHVASCWRMGTKKWHNIFTISRKDISKNRPPGRIRIPSTIHTTCCGRCPNFFFFLRQKEEEYLNSIRQHIKVIRLTVRLRSKTEEPMSHSHRPLSNPIKSNVPFNYSFAWKS